MLTATTDYRVGVSRGVFAIAAPTWKNTPNGENSILIYEGSTLRGTDLLRQGYLGI